MDSAAELTSTTDNARQYDNKAGRAEEVTVTAIDLSHHLSEVAKARRFSPLKSFSKYMAIPGIISLAGGLPDPSYFPLEALSASLLSTETYSSEISSEPSSSTAVTKKGWFASWFGGSPSKPPVQHVTVPKYVKQPTKESIGLSNALQYGGADGLPFLQSFLKEWTTLVCPPAYSDWEVLVDDGATDGWHKVVELLCNPGDPILCEAWSYPSALETGWPMGVRPVPVAIDADGLIPSALEDTLANWDEKERGCKRPRLLYTVPVGQNPTGSIITTQRRREVYEVCVKYDVIIGEDDPYYILQFPYGDDNKSTTSGSLSEDNRAFIKSLSPSYLTFDYQGRVIRLDTFSKTIAPGCRLGWITSNARFSERLLRASETSSQQPSGFTQAVVGKILQTWGMEGWVRWLRGIRAQYAERRDVMVDAFNQGFKIEVVRQASTKAGRAVSPIKMVGYAKYSSAKRTPVRTLDLDEKFASFGLGEGRPPLISFSPPEAGMFLWVTVHVASHKSFHHSAPPDERSKQTKDILNDLWETLASKKVLVAPGWFFAGDGLRKGAPDEDKSVVGKMTGDGGMSSDGENGIGHFRVAFSYSSHDTLREGIKLFSEIVTEFFE